MVTQCVQQVLHAANNSLLLTVADLLIIEQIGSDVKNTGAATGSDQCSFIKTAILMDVSKWQKDILAVLLCYL